MELIVNKNNVNDLLRLRTSKTFILIVFLIIPIVCNLIFNAVYNFNPVDYSKHSKNNYNNLSNVQMIFTLSIGLFQILGFTFMLKYSPRFFIRSGAWLIPLWWIGFNFLLGFTLGAIFSMVEKSNTNMINTLLLYSQIIFYIFLFIIYIKFSKSSVSTTKKTLKKNSYNFNWTGRLTGIKPCYDYYKIIFIPIIFAIIALLINSFISSSINSSHFKIQSENQNGINNLLHGNIAEKIGVGLLTIIFAPLIEEVVMRNGIILHQTYSKTTDRYMDNKVVTSRDFFKPFVFISAIVSIIFFANIHVEYDNFINIISYIGPAIIFVWVYFLGNGNLYYPIATHSLYNIIVFVMIIK